jgi:hypothetical protein
MKMIIPLGRELKAAALLSPRAGFENGYPVFRRLASVFDWRI